MTSKKYAIGAYAALVALLGAGVVPAHAAPTAVWKTKPAPVNYAVSLSCLSVSDCWTVSDPDEANPRPVVQRWDGSHWSAPRTMPLPKGGSAAGLEAIRCLSDHFCVAVGARFQYNTDPAVWMWHGTSWSALLAIKGTSGALADVDCVSATNCVVVGWVNGPEHALAAHWNGTAWSRDTLPSTIGSPSYLIAVSCSSASNCVAVGADNSHRQTPVIVRWNGNRWTNEVAQLPPGAPRTSLADVSCPGPNDCYAVGSSFLNHGHRYMQHWDGSRWSIVDTPAPPTASGDADAFSTLTCTVQVCTVAGYVESSSPTEHVTLFVDRGAGPRWTVENTPAVTASNGAFRDISCPDSTTCYAIGDPITSNSSLPTIFEQRTAH